MQLAREVLTEVLSTNELVLTEEAPFIQVAELGDNSVNLTVRVWVKTDDYWSVFFDINEKVYNAFKQAGLNIPFPQMDVHLHKN